MASSSSSPAREVEAYLADDYPVAFTGVRRVLSAIERAGVRVADRLIERYPAEASVLLPPDRLPGDTPSLSSVALTPSERRLHPESEQVFRILAAAAEVTVAALAEHHLSLHLLAVGATDIPSVRGLLRLVELARSRGVDDRLTLSGLDRRSELGTVLDAEGVRSPEVEQLVERIGAAGLVRAGGVAAGSAYQQGPNASAQWPEERLLTLARADTVAPTDRIAAAIESIRRGFFRSDLEVMAYAAMTGRDLCRPDLDIDGAGVSAGLARCGADPDLTDAMEFEVGVMRGTADVRAFFHKILGVVHSFRRLNQQAMHWFAQISGDPRVSVELRAQASLYRALTLVKMLKDPASARQEADSALALLQESGVEADTVDRERGWLYNVRALCAFVAKDYRGAMADERAALRCVAGKADSSSLHLKINLVSNVSVLQERGGDPRAALRTWERFSNVGTGWDLIFRKHHSYRRGGLALATGDHETAVSAFEDSLDAAAQLHDLLHQMVISLELGGLSLRRGAGSAADHYRAALAAADRFGCPYHRALGEVGLALAGGGLPDAATGKRALRSLTYQRAARTLQAAIEDGDRDRLLELLPYPRTKLNRPFDHVNLW